MTTNQSLRIHEPLSVSRLATGARLAFGLTMLMALAICASADAQGFDVEEYLKKKDANRNGKVDPSEMSNNTGGFLRKMGFDTSKAISISKIVSKVKKDRKDLASGKSLNASTATGRARQVAGFGVEAAESATVARFSAEPDASSSASSVPKYSESVMERVESTLQRYDRNKDGQLDESEMKKARWGSPAPSENDTNKDGKLSRKELAGRYATREQYYRIAASSKSAGDNDKQKKKEAEDQARREKERERFRTSGTSSSTSSSRTSYPPRSSSNTSSSSTSSSDSSAKYQKYAESLISNYDKDKDGKLSKVEVKQMRRPPVGADVDKDGFITLTELLDNLSGANRKTTASTESKTDDKSKTSSKTESRATTSRSRSTSSRSGSSSSFDKLDVNADRHVQMHEFSGDWDDETVAEFYAKDKNGDGVITIIEWSQRN